MNYIIIILLIIVIVEVTYLVTVNSKKKLHKKNGRPVFIDTSVLIDGRIIPVVKSGFVTDTLYVPRSVIGELQYLADHADTEKRARARHGLDIVKELQTLTNVKVEIFQDGSKAEEGVDERLLKLAKQYNGAVCTIDFNLNKVAQVENIPVLNVNDLAMSLRMAYLPGEKMLLELTQKGNDSHQAVGHLVDGTMVVVEHASKLIGTTAEIEFIRSLQTSAGKMMFAKLVEKDVPKILIPKGTPINNSSSKQQKQQAAKKPQVVIEKQEIVEPVLSEPKKKYVKRSPDASNAFEQKKRSVKTVAPAQTPLRAQKKPRTSSKNEDDLLKLLNSQE